MARFLNLLPTPSFYGSPRTWEQPDLAEGFGQVTKGIHSNQRNGEEKEKLRVGKI